MPRAPVPKHHSRAERSPSSAPSMTGSGEKIGNASAEVLPVFPRLLKLFPTRLSLDRPLAAGELGRPLLEKGAEPFLMVFTGHRERLALSLLS